MPKNFPESFHRKLASLPPPLTSLARKTSSSAAVRKTYLHISASRGLWATHHHQGSLHSLCAAEAGALGLPQPLPTIFSAGVGLTKESQKRGFPQVKLAALQKFRRAIL